MTKQIAIHDANFLVSRKTNSRFVTFFVSRKTPDQGTSNPRAPRISEDRHRGMSDYASYAACGQRAATLRHRWARANEEEPQLEDKTREKYENATG